MAEKKELPSAVSGADLTKKRYFKLRFIATCDQLDGMFASDFVKAFTKEDCLGMRLGESSIYNYLKSFKKEGILYYDPKTRKYYSTKRAKTMLEVEGIIADLKNVPESMLDLGLRVLEGVNQQIRGKRIERNEVFISVLGKWISAIALYCLGKEIETGQPFWFPLVSYLTYVSGPRNFIIHRIANTQKLDLEQLRELFGKGFSLGKDEKYADKMASYFDDLKAVYRDQIETLERIFKMRENSDIQV